MPILSSSLVLIVVIMVMMMMVVVIVAVLVKFELIPNFEAMTIVGHHFGSSSRILLVKAQAD